MATAANYVGFSSSRVCVNPRGKATSSVAVVQEMQRSSGNVGGVLGECKMIPFDTTVAPKNN